MTPALVVLCGFFFLTFLLLSGQAKPERCRLWRGLALLSFSPIAWYLLLWAMDLFPAATLVCLDGAALFAALLARNRRSRRRKWPLYLLASAVAALLLTMPFISLAEHVPLYVLLPPLGLAALALCLAGERAAPPVRGPLRAAGTGAAGLLAMVALLCLLLALFWR